MDKAYYMSMKRTGRIWLCVAGSAALAAGNDTVKAEIKEIAPHGPYHLISGRNVFDLHEPKEVIPPTSTVALPKVYLTGITTLLGRKQAYFVVQLPAVPGKPPGSDKYFTLAEGQRLEMLEVLQIDPKAKLVTINNSGNVSTITFETGKIAFAGAASGNGANPGGGVNLNIVNQIPGPPAVNNSHSGQPPTMTAEQQVVLMELQRAATKSQVNSGQLPPLPPTPLSDLIQQEQQQPSGGNPTPAPVLPTFPGQHNSIK